MAKKPAPPPKASPKPKASTDTPAQPVTDDPSLISAYEQGRSARRARIARADAPHGEGDELDAWQKGYDFEEEHFG